MTTTTQTMPTRLTRSDMAGLHMHSTLAPALNALPGWAELMGHLAYLEKNRPVLNEGASLEDEMAGAVADAVHARKALNLDKIAAAILARHQTHNSLTQAIERAERNYSREADMLVSTAQQHLYDYLTVQVTSTVDTAREVHEQSPRLLLMTAEAAIADGALEDWRGMQALRQTYVEATAATATLKGRLSWTMPAVVRELEWIANPHEVWDQWIPWKVNGAIVNPRRPHESKPLHPPFPNSRVTRGAELATGWFDYCVTTPEAKPWVPSESDYAGVWDTLSPLLREHASATTPRTPSRVVGM